METGIQQVEQNSGADPVKGKQVTTKRGTTPPLNFLAILNDANKSIDASSPDELCDKLYAGVFLEPNALASSLSLSSDLFLMNAFLRSYINRWNIVIYSVHISKSKTMHLYIIIARLYINIRKNYKVQPIILRNINLKI